MLATSANPCDGKPTREKRAIMSAHRELIRDSLPFITYIISPTPMAPGLRSAGVTEEIIRRHPLIWLALKDLRAWLCRRQFGRRRRRRAEACALFYRCVFW